MRISELARLTGVSPHALRHYEKLGLLSPARTPGGYRDYPAAARREVVFIAMSRKIGFSLQSIAGHLPAYRAGRLGFDDMAQAMRARIAEIDRDIAALQAQREQVVDHIAWLRAQKSKHQRRRRAAAAAPPPARPWPAVRAASSSRERP